MLPTWYLEYKNLIEKSLDEYLNDYFSTEENTDLTEIKDASIYATKWWKRIRSILALEFYLSFTGKNLSEIKNTSHIIKYCVAIELLHAYSLVHDDLPCMDNDEYRRWELTTWKKFSDATAVLTWDLLNSLSLELISEIWDSRLVKLFWNSVWFNWMIWWQVLDLFYEQNPDKLTLDKLIETHNKKTGKLIEISILGWINVAENENNLVLNLESENIKKFLDFWKKLWLAFQVKDDLLDVEWTFKETGKSVWDDEQKWFVYFLWLEKTHNYLDNLINDSKKIIKDLNSEKLNFLVEYVWNRKN